MRQTLKIGFTVLVVAALTMSGLALAQSDETPADDDISRGVTAIVERLAPLIESETISETQAQAVAEQLADGFRPGAMRRGALHGIETAAEFLGMDVEDLVAQLRDGGTLAGVAGEQTDELIAALTAEAGEHLAQVVEDGRLTQEQADERLVEIEARITTLVNEGFPGRPLGPCGGGPGGFGRGGFGPGRGEPPAAGDEA